MRIESDGSTHNVGGDKYIESVAEKVLVSVNKKVDAFKV